MKTATQTESSLEKVLDFLQCLEKSNIWYRLEHVRDSLMVVVAVPGERWEIEFFSDDHVEVERFISSGSIEGENILEDLIARHSDT